VRFRFSPGWEEPLCSRAGASQATGPRTPFLAAYNESERNSRSKTGNDLYDRELNISSDECSQEIFMIYS
jgi:hypothetical protein